MATAQRTNESHEKHITETRSDSSGHLDGEWFMEGDKNRPCAIYQRGRCLLAQNEHGALATGDVIDAQNFVILQGAGWQPGLRGVVQEGDRIIYWRNGSIWRR